MICVFNTVLLFVSVYYACAHTTSLGFVANYSTDGVNCQVMTWAGTYHNYDTGPAAVIPPLHGPEGSAQLTLVAISDYRSLSPSLVSQFSVLIYQSVPSGLTPGKNQFYASDNYSTIYPNANHLALSALPTSYQGAFFSSVPPGFYKYQYQQSSVFDDVYRPMNGIIDGLYINITCGGLNASALPYVYQKGLSYLNIVL